ncbi:PIR protein [Plasmodium vivax]|nr:PIR protein [Plasmodium vivax]
MDGEPKITTKYKSLSKSFNSIYDYYNADTEDGGEDRCNSINTYDEANSFGSNFICKRLLRNLTNFLTIGNNHEQNEDKRCIYLNVWLNDQRVNNGIYCNAIDYILSGSENTYENKCKLNRYKNGESCISISDLDDINNLLVFFENVDSIKSGLHDRANNEKYNGSKRDLKIFARIYNNNISKCVHESENKTLCEELKKFYNSYEKEVLSMYENLKNELPSLCPPPNNGQDMEHSNYECKVESKRNRNESSHALISSPVIIPGSLGALGGVSFISFLLYKYTPVISRLRPGDSRSKEKLRNGDEEKSNFRFTYDADSTYYHNRSYHLQYHPSKKK